VSGKQCKGWVDNSQVLGVRERGMSNWAVKDMDACQGVTDMDAHWMGNRCGFTLDR
jgi:hypothetical protein